MVGSALLEFESCMRVVFVDAMEPKAAIFIVVGYSLPVRLGKNSIAFALSLDMALMFVLVVAIIEPLVSVAVTL